MPFPLNINYGSSARTLSLVGSIKFSPSPANEFPFSFPLG